MECGGAPPLLRCWTWRDPLPARRASPKRRRERAPALHMPPRRASRPSRTFAVRNLFRVMAARRQIHLESGDEIQAQRRKTKGLLVSLIQEVIEAPVDFDALRQMVGETHVQQLISVISKKARKHQLASKSSIVRLDVQHRAANRSVHIEH